MEQVSTLLDGLSWPSVSFAILVASLFLSGLVLWRRYRSRRLLLKRVAELEALSAAGLSIVESELDITALCSLIAREAGKVIDIDTFQIGLFDRSDYTILYWTVSGAHRETPRTFDLSEESGIIGWVRKQRRPLLIGDFHRELESLPAKPRYISESPPRSSIFVPLISGEQVIGILAAQSDQPYRFNEEDLRRLMILANQAAAAIANAQLYARAQRRATYLELVANIARQINKVQEQGEIFEQVVRLTAETFGFDPVLILAYDEGNNQLMLSASSAPEVLRREIRFTADQGIMGAAALTREVIVSNDTAEDDRFISQIPGRPETLMNTRAELAVPLIVGDEVLGVLDVQSSQPGVFTRSIITAVETLAQEVAIAVNKARQLGQQREQAWITAVQLQVAEAIDHSEGVDELLDVIASLTTRLVGVSYCGILLWDEERELYHGATICGVEPAEAKAFSESQLSIGDWGPLDAVHVGQEALTTRVCPPWFPNSNEVWEADHEVAKLLPIGNRNERLGVMVAGTVTWSSAADSDSSHSYSRQHLELLENISRQTAQALKSAWLQIARQEEAWVNTALLQVAEAVNSLTDVNEILDTIVRLVPMLVGVRSALILIWDEETRTYRAGPSHGIGAMGRGLLKVHGVEEDEFLSVRTRPAEFLTPTATYYSMRLPPWLVKVLGTEIAHGFPLHARGRLVGVMLVGPSPDDVLFYSARRLSILNGIAHQAATALVNDQLYRESEERSLLEREIDVARQIQASLIPSGSPDIAGCSAASFWRAARQVSGDFYDFLRLPDGCWGVLIADVADKGVPAAIFMALSRTILRTVAFSRSDPADILMRANHIIDADSSSDLFVTVFCAIWNPATRTLRYANGGHNPPLLLRNNGECQQLFGKGMALGILPQIEVESRSVRIEPGDTVLLYTDGVTEAMNEDYDEFGLHRLQLVAGSARQLDAAGIMQRITAAIDEHAGGSPQFDDITLVVMKGKEVTDHG